MLGLILLLAVVAVAASGKPSPQIQPQKGKDAPWPKLTGTIGPFAYTVSPQPPLGESYAWELIGDEGVVGSSAAATADEAIRAVMELGFEHAAPGAPVTGVLGPYTFTVSTFGTGWSGFATDGGGGGSVQQWIGKPATRGLGVLQALQWLITRGAAAWLAAPATLAEPVQGGPAPLPKPPLPGPEGWRHVGPWWLLVRPADGGAWLWAAFDPRDLEAARALDEDDDVEGLGELSRAAGEGPAGDDGTATLDDALMWAQQHSAETVRHGLAFTPTCDAVRVVDLKAWLAWAAPRVRSGLRAGTLKVPMQAFVLLAAAAPAKCPLATMSLSGRTFDTASASIGKALERWYEEEWWNQTPVDEVIASLLVDKVYTRAGTATLYKQHLIVTRPGPAGHLWSVYYGQRGFDDDPILAGGESKASAANAVAVAKKWVDDYGQFEVGLEGEGG